jgi:hypothetical protein
VQSTVLCNGVLLLQQGYSLFLMPPNSARSVVGGEGQDVVKNTEINLITISGYLLSVIAHRQVVQEYFTFRKFLYDKNSC